MNEPTITFSDEEVERYLSIEWEVAQERAIKLTRFAKQLVAALEQASKHLKAAADEGDVYTMSADVTALAMLLETCEGQLDHSEAASVAHYVELLGSREALSRMGEVIAEFFFGGREELPELPEPRFTSGGGPIL